MLPEYEYVEASIFIIDSYSVQVKLESMIFGKLNLPICILKMKFPACYIAQWWIQGGTRDAHPLMVQILSFSCQLIPRLGLTSPSKKSKIHHFSSSSRDQVSQIQRQIGNVRG